jgi:hypothetical protein
MHIHNTSSNYAANLYAAGNDPRTAAAQRAADTRKKLLNAAQAAGAAGEDGLFLSHLLDASASAQPQTQVQSQGQSQAQSQAQSANHPYASYPPRDLNFG